MFKDFWFYSTIFLFIETLFGNQMWDVKSDFDAIMSIQKSHGAKG